MTDLLSMAGAAFPFVITPGSSFSLVLSHASLGLRKGWLPICCGTAIGILAVATLLGATGLGSALQDHPRIPAYLGLGGSVVFIAIGISLIVQQRRTRPERATASGGLGRWSFVSVVTNPKALGLYVLLVPALGNTRLNGLGLFLAFATVHIVMQSAWLLLVHEGAARIPGLANSARTRLALAIAAGALMIGLGLIAGVTALAQILQLSAAA